MTLCKIKLSLSQNLFFIFIFYQKGPFFLAYNNLHQQWRWGKGVGEYINLGYQRWLGHEKASLSSELSTTLTILALFQEVQFFEHLYTNIGFYFDNNWHKNTILFPLIHNVSYQCKVINILLYTTRIWLI